MRPFQIDLNQIPPLNQEELESRSRKVLRQRMNLFWRQRLTEIQNTKDAKSSVLPLARIRRLMKTNPEVKMVSADSSVLFAKACELLMLEMTFRAWLITEADRRLIVQRYDITKAIADHHLPVFQFLHDILKCGDQNGEVEEAEARPHVVLKRRRPLLNLNE